MIADGDRSGLESREAEAALLGSLIRDPLVVSEIMSRSKLGPQAFFYREYQVIAENILQMIEAGQYVDLVTIMERLRDRNQLAEVGGLDRLQEASDMAPTTYHAQSYLDSVRQAWIRRQGVELAKEVDSSSRFSEDPESDLSGIGERVNAILECKPRAPANREVLDKLLLRWREAKRRRETGEKVVIQGVSTGIAAIDAVLGGGMANKMYYIWAGRPSDGKTVWEDMVSCHVAGVQKKHVARVTIDLDQERLLRRAACRMGGVSVRKLETGYAGEKNLADAAEAADVIAEWPLHFLEGVTELHEILRWFRYMKAKHDIALATLDYVQQVTYSGAGKWMTESETLSKISGSFKNLAKELEIPFMGLAQLSRANQKENGMKKPRRPRLSDLRGSGSLEQDAAAVLFTYRDPDLCAEADEDFEGDDDDHKRPSWLEIAKQQDGGLARGEFWLRGPYFKFEAAPENFGIPPEVEGL